MYSFTSYNKITGEIEGNISCSVCTTPSPDNITGYIVGEFLPNEYYVDVATEQPVPYTSEVMQAKASRPTYPARWSNTSMQWEAIWNPDTFIPVALSKIDDMAGYARLRYITSVPGQAETYAKKEQQANEWAAASFAGDPPSFIAAEASALNIPPIDIANQIILLANQWSNIKGPQIEATRRKWKVAAEQATTPQELESILAQAESELNAL